MSCDSLTCLTNTCTSVWFSARTCQYILLQSLFKQNRKPNKTSLRSTATARHCFMVTSTVHMGVECYGDKAVENFTLL